MGTTSPDETYYDVLGIRPDADPDRVHRAYFAILKEVESTPDAEPGVRDRLDQVRTAYKILSHIESRTAYNAGLGLDPPPQRKWTLPDEEEVGPTNWAEMGWPMAWLPRSAWPWVIGAFLFLGIIAIVESR